MIGKIKEFLHVWTDVFYAALHRWNGVTLPLQAYTLAHDGTEMQAGNAGCSTLRHNICLLEDFSDEQLAHAVAAAGLADWVATLPEGLDTVLSENGKNLSGGQRQRIGIARLALRKYDLIIADEITASLDPETSAQVMQNLLSMPCMVVAITHDTSGAFMQEFDKIYRVENGVVSAA